MSLPIYKILKFDIENTLHNSHLDITVIGCDEVGRGCIAGPIVGGAVYWDLSFLKNALNLSKNILQEDNLDEISDERVGELKKILSKKLNVLLKQEKKNNIEETASPYYDLFMLLQIDDSKRLSQKKRELLSKYIKEKARAYSIFEISSEEIDTNGVGEANKKVLENSALNIIKQYPQKRTGILVDHFSIFKENPEFIKIPITKGDQKSLSIAAASIIAKVHRDELMQKYHQVYPHYNFDSNMGYGTVANIAAIKQKGLSPIHRKSFCENFF